MNKLIPIWAIWNPNTAADEKADVQPALPVLCAAPANVQIPGMRRGLRRAMQPNRPRPPAMSA